MNRIPALTLSLFAAGLLVAGSVSAAEPAKTVKTKAVVAKAEAGKKTAAPSSRHLHNDVNEVLTEGQLAAASRVLTGAAQCEFDQSVSVDAMKDKPGHFRVAFKNATYTMTPQETTTGAVRLEDRHNGIVWLQIPSKSMMMNHKVGQRMVDGCMHAEQRAAVAAVKAAAR
jgi:hypothetical protein